ncbi:cell cycle checkpoint control protein RAD9A [Lampris incognitus]|uniref:cell cycle checkpoint control protein RAD9A n=1 Tax=Lampris incognitus TaxID=2546036 RepID=UPI0024B54021|nr:cell cycle checkpoint control protein RAD9A [Lampris incognitus]
MDSVVTGGNVKVLAKAIHSLSRIGDELYLEPQEDGLGLRSVNASRSAYACFLFAPLFFSRYTIPHGQALRCKMVIKSVQTVFRSLASLEKTVDKCHIQLDEEKSRITFTLHCKHGLLKTHNLRFQDSESLQAVFDKDSCSNVLRAQPRLLVETVLHFPPSLEEVTLSVNNEYIWFRNHVGEEAEQSKTMATEMCLSSDEFDHFAVRAEKSITFCLKELRGLLVFAESTGLPISMYFDEPGSPVILSVTDSVLEVNFVLATLSDESSLHNKRTQRVSTLSCTTDDDLMNDDMDSYLIAMDTSTVPQPSATDPSTPTLSSDAHSHQSPSANHTTRPDSEEETDEQVNPDSLAGPPNKKFRSLFFGSVFSTSSQVTNQMVTGREVLASDSDDDTQAELP